MQDQKSVDREELTLAWEGAIENSGARGKVRKAFRGYAKYDVSMIQESTRNAAPGVREAWLNYAPKWAEAEVDRLTKWVNTQRDLRKKGEWEKKRKDARKHKRHRTRGLAQKIVDYVSGQGGAIDFNPSVVAGAVSKKPGLGFRKVAGVMRMLTKDGTAKIVAVGKGKPDRFVLRASQALLAPPD